MNKVVCVTPGGVCLAHLVSDSGPQQQEGEAGGHHREDAEGDRQQDGEPDIWLVEGVPGRA